MTNSFYEIIDFDFKSAKKKYSKLKTILFRISLFLLLVTGLAQYCFSGAFLYTLFLTSFSFCFFFFSRLYNHQKYNIKNILDFSVSLFFCLGLTFKFMFPDIGNILIALSLLLLVFTKAIPMLLSK